MELLWFYIAIVLAISDIVHGQLTWNIFLEAVFHFIILSLVFLNIEIGFLAALIHLTIDLTHSIFIRNMSTIEHRAMHFVIESLFFIIIFGF